MSQRPSGVAPDPALAKDLARHPEYAAEAVARRTVDLRVASLLRTVPADEMAASEAISSAMAAAVAPRHVICRQPAVWAVAVAILATAAIVGLRALMAEGGFEGREVVEELLGIVARQDGSELSPVEAKVATLGDWFFLNHGLEHYDMPAFLARERAEGCRVFRLAGQPVVQVAIGRDELLAHMMTARPLGIVLPANGSWRFVEESGWAAAAQRQGDKAVVLARMGSADDLRSILVLREKEGAASSPAPIAPLREEDPEAPQTGATGP